MEPFDSIERWITEHGSAAILRQHLELLKEQMAAKDAKIRELEARQKNIEVERDGYKAIADKYEGQQPGDTCLFCRRPTGQLIQHLGPGNLSAKWAHRETYIFRCCHPTCGMEYSRAVKQDTL